MCVHEQYLKVEVQSVYLFCTLCTIILCSNPHGRSKYITLSLWMSFEWVGLYHIVSPPQCHCHSPLSISPPLSISIHCLSLPMHCLSLPTVYLSPYTVYLSPLLISPHALSIFLSPHCLYLPKMAACTLFPLHRVYLHGVLLS